MTMPHLENCSHTGSGWCGDCVKSLGEENLRLSESLRQQSGCERCLMDHFAAGDDVTQELAVELTQAKLTIESLQGQVEFGKHLNHATIDVSAWPEWKQVILGGKRTSLASILNDYLQLQARLTVVVATLSHRIAQQLSEQHGSLRAAARATGLSPTYLCQVARGNATLSIDRTLKILKNNPCEGDI